jgi:hypothetical protein
MAAPRKTAIRGTIARGDSAASRRRATPAAPSTPPEPVAHPDRPRSVVDHALQRRAALRRLFTGTGALSSDLCDADPYLLKAARFHGEETGTACPACRADGLVTVTYVFGDELGPYSGRIRKAEDLPGMAFSFGAFSVYVVEVCQRCHWNFLLTTYVLGDGVPRRALPTPRDLLD